MYLKFSASPLDGGDFHVEDVVELSLADAVAVVDKFLRLVAGVSVELLKERLDHLFGVQDDLSDLIAFVWVASLEAHL